MEWMFIFGLSRSVAATLSGPTGIRPPRNDVFFWFVRPQAALAPPLGELSKIYDFD